MSATEPLPGAIPAGIVPFLDLLGIGRFQLEEGRGRLELTVRAEHLRSFGIVHGGVTATLLDSVMGMAASSRAPEGHDVVTAQLNIHFIRPGWEGEHLLASSEIQHSGRRTAVASGEIRNEHGALIASGSGTFLFVPRPSTGTPRFERSATEPSAPTG